MDRHFNICKKAGASRHCDVVAAGMLGGVLVVVQSAELLIIARKAAISVAYD